MAAMTEMGRAVPAAAVAEQSSRRIAWARGAAFACLTGLAATWVLATHVASARMHDAAALAGFSYLARPAIDSLAHGLLAVLSPAPTVLIAAALVTVALVRRRPRIAVAIPFVILAAVVTADVLKPLLGSTRGGFVAPGAVGWSSWPSGHAAAAMAVALCALLVAPARLRPAVAVAGAIFSTAVAFALLTLAWHMPSDIVGGFLIAGLWTAVAIWGLLAAQRRWPDRSGRAALTRAGTNLRQRGTLARDAGRAQTGAAGNTAAVGWALAALLAGATLALVAAVVASRPHAALDFSDTHHAVLAAAAIIAALATTLMAALAYALRN